PSLATLSRTDRTRSRMRRTPRPSIVEPVELATDAALGPLDDAATAGAWGITSCDDVLYHPSERNDNSDRHSQREDHDWEHDEDQFPESRQHVSASPLSPERSTKPRVGRWPHPERRLYRPSTDSRAPVLRLVRVRVQPVQGGPQGHQPDRGSWAQPAKTEASSGQVSRGASRCGVSWAH